MKNISGTNKDNITNSTPLPHEPGVVIAEQDTKRTLISRSSIINSSHLYKKTREKRNARCGARGLTRKTPA
jgi:hypothetical protein